MCKQLRAACQSGPKSHCPWSLLCSPCRNTVATKLAARREPRANTEGWELTVQPTQTARERTATNDREQLYKVLRRHFRVVPPFLSSADAVLPVRFLRITVSLSKCSEKLYQIQPRLSRNCRFSASRRHPRTAG